MKHRWTTLGLIVAVLVIGYALAQGMGGGPHHNNDNHHPGQHRRMQDMPGMQRGMMGGQNMMGMHRVESEFDFLTGMIPHHREAVEHATWVLERSEQSEMLELAQGIIDEQAREIEIIRGWLEDWYPEQPHGVAYRPMMRDTRDLTPELADRVFLEDMIMHHMMAIMKAEVVLEQNLAERNEVTELAADIIDAQQAEVEMMNRWLDDWYGAAVDMQPCPRHNGQHRHRR